MAQSSQPGERADLALAALLAPSAQKRRLLWIGDPRSGAPSRLARAATSVRVLDTTARRRRQRGGAIQVTSFKPGPLSFTAGSFDVVVVPDLSVFDDVSSRISDLVAIVDDGLVVVGIPAIDERVRSVRDQLRSHFSQVSLFGGSGFRAFALAELGLREVEDVLVDGTLLEGRTNVERVFALAGESLPAIDPFTLVQLPPGLAEGPAPAQPDEGAALREALERAEVRLDQVQRRLVTTEGELAEARATLREIDAATLDSSSDAKALDSSDETPLDEVDEETETGELDLHPHAEPEADEPSVEADDADATEVDATDPEAEPEPEVGLAVEREVVSLELDHASREAEELEAKLAAAGHRIVELEVELRRRARVFRDAVEELREHQLQRRGPSSELALDVEAELALAEFRGDEAEVETAALRHERDELLAGQDVLERELARVEGERRGLRARLAERNELGEMQAARVALLEADVATLREQVRGLEGELGETREQLELEMLRARSAPPAREPSPELQEELSGLRERVAELDHSERHLSARVGQLSGQLVAARDLLGRAEADRDRARAETLRMTAQLGALEVREQGLRYGYELRVAELTAEARGGRADEGERTITGRDDAIAAELDGLQRELLRLRGEREGLRLRLEDEEAARRQDDRACDHVARLERELQAARLRATDEAVALASRDALINRLQLDLADEERNAESADARRRTLEAEVSRLRSAVVNASEEVDRREAAEAQLQDERSTSTSLRGALANAEGRVLAEQGKAESTMAELARAQERILELEESLRDGERRSSEHDDRHGLMEAEFAGMRARLEAAQQARRDTEGLLHDLRVRLDQLGTELSAPERARSEITSVGMSSPGLEEGFGPEGVAQELRDKDTLLRSLTAQLEERNDRLRALERRLAGEVEESEHEQLARSVLELEERAARLHEELENERVARHDAVQRAQLLESQARPEELEHLEDTLALQSDQLDAARERGDALERDLGSLQEILGATRQGLEAALDRELDAELADRLGALLNVLGGY